MKKLLLYLLACTGYSLGGELHTVKLPFVNAPGNSELRFSEWTNPGPPMFIHSAWLWAGATSGGRGDFAFSLILIHAQTGLRDVILEENWDHYDDPKGAPDNIFASQPFAPDYYIAQTGDILETRAVGGIAIYQPTQFGTFLPWGVPWWFDAVTGSSQYGPPELLLGKISVVGYVRYTLSP